MGAAGSAWCPGGRQMPKPVVVLRVPPAPPITTLTTLPRPAHCIRQPAVVCGPTAESRRGKSRAQASEWRGRRRSVSPAASASAATVEASTTASTTAIAAPEAWQNMEPVTVQFGPSSDAEDATEYTEEDRIIDHIRTYRRRLEALVLSKTEHHKQYCPPPTASHLSWAPHAGFAAVDI